MSLKSKLEQCEEYQEGSPAARRKQMKIIAELDQFLRLVSSEARKKSVRKKSMKGSEKN
jgi:hypothetical protein